MNEYLGGYQYLKPTASSSTTLQFFPTAEGYVEPASSFKYVFQYKDHLGNVRLSYKDSDGNGSIASSEILEENNYYPFGLKHMGYGPAIVSTNPGLKYKYNGKELQDEIGLGVYAYGWRDYDPAIGRFLKIDRFAEKYMERTPYNYAANNPVYYVDVAGDSLYVTHRKGFLGLGGKETLKYENGNLYNRDGSAYGGKVNGFLKKTVDALSSITATAEGSSAVTELQNSNNNFTIVKSSQNSFVADNSRNSFANIPQIQALVPNLSSTGSGGTIKFNPSTTTSGFNTLGNTERPGYVGLAHEMFHGRDSNQGVLYPSNNYNTYNATDNGLKKSEWRAVYYENILRRQAGLPLRTSYGIQLTPSGPQPMGPNMLNSNNQPINVPIR
jgi:RHS repeat-associated protein